VTFNDQLDVMRNDERAWLQVRMPGQYEPEGPKPVEITAGQPIEVSLELLNVGKTPAQNVVVQSTIELPDSSNGPNLSSMNDIVAVHTSVTVPTFFPNSKTSVDITRLEKTRSKPLVATDDEVQAWISGKKYFAIYGIATYTDIFKVEHVTQFCMWQPSSSALKAGGSAHARDCVTFNEAK
jgi:hypothetical protein